jgi:branched-chain amino acid transport system ATP-binding protein
MALLEVEAIETYYGDSQALFGVSFTVEQGGVTALLGRNGMGKTTTVKTVMGLLHPRRGRVRFAGKNIHAVPAFRVAQAGIGLVPEMRQIFPALSTYENLIATAAHRDQAREPWTLERVFQLFPRLRERQRQLGASLSGGEQQMLAIGRALMTTPRLLILPWSPQAGWSLTSGYRQESSAVAALGRPTHHPRHRTRGLERFGRGAARRT